MSSPRVNLISAFGRGESLALALHESGFNVTVLDFTSAFASEYDRGAGPFPILNKAFMPSQREYLNEAKPLAQGLTFWLKDGPLELTGPFAETHALQHREVVAWKSGATGGEFSAVWLQRFLRQWASPYFSESWNNENDSPFPADQPIGVLPFARESSVQSFDRAESKGVNVQNCQGFRDVRISGGRIHELEVDAGSAKALQAEQWVWCLSSSETKGFGGDVASRVFPRGLRAPDWCWVSFAGQTLRGTWSAGLPPYAVLLGDIYLPWVYANAAVLRRVDETRFRFWLKVPRARVDDIDARRGWATELQRLLQTRLNLAEWTVNSAEWSICPHSEIFATSERGESVTQWKNWSLIAPETLPRLDTGARLEREAEVFRRLTQWRNDQLKKQGVPRDHTLHAP